MEFNRENLSPWAPIFAKFQQFLKLNSNKKYLTSGHTTRRNSGAATNYPHPQVVNLLLNLVFVEATRTGTGVVDTLPGCPNNAEEIVQYLSELQTFHTAEDLDKALTPPRTEAQELLLWICDTYGSIFSLATDDLAVPEFPKNVLQFVVTKQRNKEQYRKFKRRLARTGKSMILFHGTGFHSLFSILLDGFSPSENERYGKGTFMAEEPRTAYLFALRHGGFLGHGERGKGFLRGCGLVLGCEVVGKGHVVKTGEEVYTGPAHLIKNKEKIAVRYVFVLPEEYEIPKGRVFINYAPKREKVLNAMVENFRKIDTTARTTETMR